MLLQEGKLTKLPDRPLQVVTYKFLSERGDGYEMLPSFKWVSVARSLKERLREVLRVRTEPIQPQVEGRICNVTELGRRPCAFKDFLKK